MTEPASATRLARCAFALLAFFLAGAQGSEPPRLSFYSTESPPIWSRRLPHGGLGGEILQALAARAGIAAVLDYLPLKRFVELQSGNRVGNPQFFAGQAAAAIVPLLVTRAVLGYYAPHHPQGVRFQEWTDLKGLTLGVERGTLEDKRQFLDIGIGVEESATPEALFRKLRKGRVDAILVLDLMGHYYVDRLFPGETADFRFIALSGGITPIAAILDSATPGSEALTASLWKAMDGLVADGGYYRMLQTAYGPAGVPPDWRRQLQRLMDGFKGKKVISDAE
ncbi:MAG: transporter substrate-binding domain-containing protein [Methylococcus sp.]|nr:transporter substrate-binding domain-containing protein [Methylococcus sp.]